jgi:hypothetical protein
MYRLYAKMEHGDGAIEFRTGDDIDSYEKDWQFICTCTEKGYKYLYYVIGGFGHKSTEKRERSASAYDYARQRVEFARFKIGKEHFNYDK